MKYTARKAYPQGWYAVERKRDGFNSFVFWGYFETLADARREAIKVRPSRIVYSELISQHS